MKLTKRGYRISKNGVVLKTLQKHSIPKKTYEGKVIKENGEYYFFDRKQGQEYIYLP